MPRTLLISGGTFLLGGVAAAAVLIVNPFAPASRAAQPIQAADADGHVVETFTINAPTDIVAITHNGSNIINPTPVGITLFSEPALQPGLVLVAKLRDAAGEVVGFAVESEVSDPANNLLLGKIRMNSDWTIILPGRGTIFATQIEDGGAIGMDIIPTVMTGGTWKGEADFVSTNGPHGSGRGLVVGGSEEFAGITGTFLELTHLREMSQANGGVGVFELQVSYRQP